MRTLIWNARIVSPEEIVTGYLIIEGEFIVQKGEGAPDELITKSVDRIIDFEGDLLLPGVIDTHVHFRDPGLTDKGDIESESKAAVAGGVTSYIDMPNTLPQTISFPAVSDKERRAQKVSWANYSFFIGATEDNINELIDGDYSHCAGVKVFLGSSTGNMCLDSEEKLRRLAMELPAGVPMAFHAEDNSIIKKNAEAVSDVLDEIPIDYHPFIRSREACLNAARRVVSLVRETGRRCVLLHLSTTEELSLASGVENLYLETCPQYLAFEINDYQIKGAKIKCNPAIKNRSDRDALRDALNGTISHISTDHAPHLLKNKEGDALNAASGMPGIQFSLPILLSLTDECNVVRLMCSSPAQVYGIRNRGELTPGFYADIVRVRKEENKPGVDTPLFGKCQWTPYQGLELNHKVITTWVNGECVYDKGEIRQRPKVYPLLFSRTITHSKF